MYIYYGNEVKYFLNIYFLGGGGGDVPFLTTDSVRFY